MKEIYDVLREFRHRRAGQFALATLVRAEGSSYRRPGARMLICEDGRTIGSLSAGCLEEEVATRAHNVLKTGEPAIMSFDTQRRFGCDGKIDIFIERASEKFLSNLAAHLDARRSCLAVTTFEGSSVGEAGSFLSQNETVRENWEANSFPCSPFMQEIHPPIRLLIFGDGPENPPLCSLGDLLGWQVIEILDTAAFSFERDEWTAAIVKSHNYGRDFVALQNFLSLDLRYVGLIGPRKRRDQLLNELLDQDVTINAGFFSPAGIDLGGETPAEIALEIVSEIQRVFAHGSGDSLRERKMSIHAAQCKISAR